MKFIKGEDSLTDRYDPIVLSCIIQKTGRFTLVCLTEDLLDLYAGGSFRGSGREKEAGSAAGPPRPEGAAAGCVHILTMHACKGLEFDSVFIPDLNEGTIPSKRAWSQGQVEEERRLLYVAMTRARRSLTLLYLEGTPDRPAEPSRFLQSFRIRGR